MCSREGTWVQPDSQAKMGVYHSRPRILPVWTVKKMCQAGVVCVIGLLLVATSCVPEIGVTTYTEKSFTVGVGEKYNIAVELRAGQTVEGDFSISGQEDYIDFYIKDAYGGLTYGVVRAVGSHRFVAKASYSGSHTLCFDNSFSFGTGRQVSVRYRVR